MSSRSYWSILLTTLTLWAGSTVLAGWVLPHIVKESTYWPTLLIISVLGLLAAAFGAIGHQVANTRNELHEWTTLAPLFLLVVAIVVSAIMWAFDGEAYIGHVWLVFAFAVVNSTVASLVNYANFTPEKDEAQPQPQG
jgi:hypothetical protein